MRYVNVGRTPVVQPDNIKGRPGVRSLFALLEAGLLLLLLLLDLELLST